MLHGAGVLASKNLAVTVAKRMHNKKNVLRYSDDAIATVQYAY